MLRVTGDFSRGAFYGNQINGFQVAEMQKQENTDNLISSFEQLIAIGYNPNNSVAIQRAFEKVGISEEDTTSYDRKRLVSKVEQIYRSNRSHK